MYSAFSLPLSMQLVVSVILNLQPLLSMDHIAGQRLVVVSLVSNSAYLVLLLEGALPLSLDYVQKVGSGKSLISLHVGAVSFFMCTK